MLSKRVVAIDVGAYSTKIVVGSQHDKKVSVENVFLIPTPIGAYDDGNILDTSLLGDSIKQILKDNKIRAKKVIFTVGSSFTLMREVELPYVNGDEIESMVRFEIEQYLPIDFDENIIQHRLLQEFMEEDKKKLRILVAAMPKKIVEPYLSLIKTLKLKPLALDIHSNSVTKIFEIEGQINKENYSLDDTVAVIDIGHSYTNINIITEGYLELNRRLQSGGKYLTESIANSYNLSMEEAGERKIEHGDLELLNDMLLNPTIINELIQGEVNLWIDEMRRVFQFYTSRRTGNRIDKIFLYGGGSKIRALDKYIEANINLPTFRLESLKGVELLGSAKDCDIDVFLNSIGAIIRR